MVTSAKTPLLESNGDSEPGSSSRSEYITFKKDAIETGRPRDRFHLAYIIFYLLGITTLLPWNFFITADDYWMYKFRDVKTQLKLTVAPLKRTHLQATFTSYLSLASNLPNILCLLINMALIHRVHLQIRMITSLVVMLCFFILTTIFVDIDTDHWQSGFFILTLSTVVLLNVSGAIMNGSLFGVVGKFSPKYITAVVGGQALGGIVASVAEIVSLTIGASSTHSAFVYFMIGNAMILFSLISYILLSNMAFFKHETAHHLPASGGEGDANPDELGAELILPHHVSYRAVLRKIWPYGLANLLVFMGTLSVYPSVTVLIESEGKGRGHKWNDVYFVPVVGYLVFNLWDYIGRLLAGIAQWPRNRWVLIGLTVVRLFFVPLFVFCNAQPRYQLPVLIDKDSYYIVIMSIFGISNGFLTNLTMICAPNVVERHEKEAASSMMTVALGLGLIIGSGISVLIVEFILASTD